MELTENQKLNWEFVITLDGSPSLRDLNSERKEIMHHSGGALSESRYIYGRLIQGVWEWGLKPKFLSLGLGLGYNELLVAEKALELDQSFSMISYEADNFLIQMLLASLKGQGDPGDEWTKIYLKIMSLFSPEVPKRLLKAYEAGDWVIKGALETDSSTESDVQAFLWDAFSRKTTPHLWDESFLIYFVGGSQATHTAVGFTTYACNGPLKRALKYLGYEIDLQPGFSGKRQSLLAYKK